MTARCPKRRCSRGEGAQLQAGGNGVHVLLSYSRTAAPAPASKEIRGYAGMCADDSRDSPALRTAIVAWKCNGSDAAQAWSLSGGELKHGSMCMNDKAGGGSGSRVVLYTCNGGTNELWSHNSHGEYVLKAHGRASSNSCRSACPACIWPGTKRAGPSMRSQASH